MVREEEEGEGKRKRVVREEEEGERERKGREGGKASEENVRRKRNRTEMESHRNDFLLHCDSLHMFKSSLL